MLDIARIRQEFPILQREINGRPLIYLDNAATSQKPVSVLETERQYYEMLNANVHRGIHTLSQEATNAMEESRKKIQHFINAAHDHEVIFTRGTTEAINTVAYALGNSGRLKAGDEILISHLEHHSNIVPWQMLCERTGALLKVIPMLENGTLDLAALPGLLSERTKMVSLSYVSNALGVINPVQEVISQVRAATGALVLLDAAQAAPHFALDVQALDCDLLAFSGHKMYGPTGTGILYGKTAVLESLPPFLGGGEMITTCDFSGTTFAALPFKFEAGTPNIAGNIALGAAVDFINDLGRENIASHEQMLVQYADERLSALPYLRIYGLGAPRIGVTSFNLEGVGISSDVGMILDKMGIAVRTGHHCTQPIMRFYNIAGTVRASFAVYNTKEEVDLLVEGVQKAYGMLG